jgi:hypothetical protein
MSATVAPFGNADGVQGLFRGFLGLALGPHQPGRASHAHHGSGLAAGDGMHVLAAGQRSEGQQAS